MNRGLVYEDLEAVNSPLFIIQEFSRKDEQNHHLVQPNLEPNTSEIQEQRITFTYSLTQFKHQNF